MKNINGQPVRTAALIQHVREVILSGTADLAYWRKTLAGEGYFPFATNGAATITISAPRLVWMGLRFCELSVSIAVSTHDGATQPDGLLLVQAFNSSKILAFMERAFFSTPYVLADVRVQDELPASVVLAHAGQPRLQARMSAPTAPAVTENLTWEGAVFLPRAHANAPRKRFMAQLLGDADRYAFSPTDTFTVQPAAPDDVFAKLRDSGFAPQTWHLRQNATHAKSYTLAE